MRFHTPLWALTLLCLAALAAAERMLTTSSLLTCMEDSQLTAQSFRARLLPDEKRIEFNISAITTMTGKLIAKVSVIAYGIDAVQESVSLCSLDVDQVCPLTAGHLDLSYSYELKQDILDKIPGIAYTVPDLDGVVKVVLVSEDDQNTPVACVQARLSNGKTVQTQIVGWIVAVIAGIGLLTAGVVSVIGHSNTAAHIAANSVSLFVYFQSLAIIGMIAVERLPPIAAAWTQNFQWSMGIIRVGFLQKIYNWYVQATGGTTTNTIFNKDLLSISVQKRAVGDLAELAGRVYSRLPAGVATQWLGAALQARADSTTDIDTDESSLYTTDEKSNDLGSKILVLRGIQRVAYLANIDITNLFLTAVGTTLIFSMFVVFFLFLFKWIIESMVALGWIHSAKFDEYRRDWTSITKGTLYRISLVAFPQLSLMCMWEFVERDSPAVVVLAAFVYVINVALLAWASFRLIQLARGYIREFNNPAYVLFSEPKVLNRLGFLYVQYAASAYYFVVVYLLYVFARSVFIAFGQEQGKMTALAVFIIELVYFGILCWRRPYMDRRTNVFNILISVVNLVNSLFYLFFSKLFPVPDYVGSIMAVVLFVLNAIFSLGMLIFTIVTCVLALVYKNPDTRYKPMKDDRVSFIPQTGSRAPVDKELQDLGAQVATGHDSSIYDEIDGGDPFDGRFPVSNLPYTGVPTIPDDSSSSNSTHDSHRPPPYVGFRS